MLNIFSKIKQHGLAKEKSYTLPVFSRLYFHVSLIF